MNKRTLTGKQQRYVQHTVEVGDHIEAAVLAGYARASARIAVWRMQRLPHVREALREAMATAFANDGPIARVHLHRIMKDPAASGTASVRAAELLLDRGLGKITETHAHMHLHRTEEAAAADPEGLRQRVMLLAEKLGLVVTDPRAQPVLQTAYQEVSAEIRHEIASPDFRGNARVAERIETASRGAEDAPHQRRPEEG